MATEQPQQPQPVMAPMATAPGAPLPSTAGNPAPITRGWHIAKLVLGGTALVSSIILIALSIATFVESDLLGYELVWTIPVAGVALCWQVAEFITLCARRGLSRKQNNLGRGIHPGAHVGMHLILWMGFVINVVIDAFNAYYLDMDWSAYYDDSGYSYGSSGYAHFNYVYSPHYRAITRALAAFSAISFVVHFILFVRACVETHARNTATRTDNVRYVYVQQPVYYQQAAPNGQFVPPPPMVQQQQFIGQEPQQPQPAH